MSLYNALFEVEYPCEGCSSNTELRTCQQYKHCKAWRTWFSAHWRRIQLSALGVGGRGGGKIRIIPSAEHKSKEDT